MACDDLEKCLSWSFINKRLSLPWLMPLGYLMEVLQGTYEQALRIDENHIIILADTDPIRFWGRFLGIVLANRTVCLLSPHSTKLQWQHACEVVKPAFIYHEDLAVLQSENQIWWGGKILIPTGGSGGVLKLAIHSWESLSHAVKGLSMVLPGPLHSVMGLPLYHVSGLMPGLRALLTGGTVTYHSMKLLDDALYAVLDGACVSLVPTQLIRLMDNPIAFNYFKKARVIFLGGASPHAGDGDKVLKCAQHHQLPIVFTYGMTETAAMVAMSRVEDFLEGRPCVAWPMPHAHLCIEDEASGQRIASGEGRLWVAAKSLFQGYFPHIESIIDYRTGDLGYFDDRGGLVKVRRADRCVVCGGEKLDLHLIESVLEKTQLLKAFYLKGEVSSGWGEQVVLYYVPKDASLLSLQLLKDAIKGSLGPLFVPKRWVCLSALPFKENGKIDLSRLEG